MKIKRLEICGFKSFVDRTVITFPDPVTAIVGPNGCGKSNVVDAIRWCMGEQSAKHLRGRAMEDVIFAGSESRGPAAFAEVSLTFDMVGMASDAASGGVPWGHVGPEEVVITRRLHRDGQSEYLLGGVPCRLRDVVDFFLGTGVGTKAYSIIEQGRVGFIVSSRPEDRRTLIDEAAGITKYKAKKRLAEKRMDQTKQHLLRASDIIGEIESRLRTLRLQAQKAERYKRYKAELRDLDLWSSSHRFLGLLAEEKSLVFERADVAERHEREATDLAVNEAEVEVERLSLSEEMGELATAKDELFALSNKAQLGMQRAEHYADEAESLANRVDEESRERADLSTRAADNAAFVADLEGQLTTLATEAETRRTDFQERERVYEGLRGDLSLARRRLDEATASSTVARTRIARAESDSEAASARRMDLARRVEALAGDDAAIAGQLADVEQEASVSEARLGELESRKRELAEARVSAAERQLTLKGEVTRGELELETLREESHRRRSRLQSLREIENRYESFQRGVRAIMQRSREAEAEAGAGHALGSASEHAEGTDVAGATSWAGTGIKGLVADIVQPPPELETAVEAVLGERLGNVIVDSHEVGIEAIQFLKNRSEGRSSFIPLQLRGSGAGEVVYDASGGVSVNAPQPIAVPWPSGEGVRGPMLELIGYDRQYDRVAAYLLGDVVVVEDLRKALALWRETGTAKTIVTLDGEVIDPQGVVTGGSREGAVAGILSQKREIRELEEVVERIEADRQSAMARHVSIKQELAEVSAQLDEILSAVRAAEMDVLGAQKDLDRARRDRQQLEGRRTQLSRSRAELDLGIENNEQRLAELQVLLEGERERAAEAEAAVDQIRGETLSLGDRLDAMVEELTTLKVAATQAEDRRASATSTLSRVRREQAEQEARVARLDVTVAEQAHKAEALRADADRIREEASLWMAEAEARARTHGERQSAVEERSGILARKEAEVRTARSSVAELGQTLASLELRCQQATLKRASLEEQVADRYSDAKLGDVVFDYHLRAPVGHDEENRISELRGLIERMGEINLTAIEESEELQKRYDFLTSQKADLESAITQLESAIEKINRASRERFQEVFDAVNAKFQEVYPRMFGGGRASLRLTDDGDLLEKGVEITANPPGKKIAQNIELLSGGEKALTAVALLFAIFLVKPSPFCILDEVDAPLDEANVGRYNEAIREMTDRSQFIVITHNKRTMEIADRLCGVTMEEPGVSKLVAVNLRGSRSARDIGKGQVGTADGTAPGATPVASSA